MADVPTDKNRKTIRRDLVWLIWETFQYTHRNFDDVLRPHGVTSTQCAALIRIAEQPGLSGADLARLTLTTTQAANLALTALERKKLVDRKRDEGAGHVLHSVLTETGRTVMSACLKEVRDAERKLLASLSEAERDTLRDLLQKYIAPWTSDA